MSYHKLLTCLAFGLTLLRLSAQDAYHTILTGQLQDSNSLSGGQWVLPNTESATFAAATNYGAVVTNFPVSGYPFTQARRFEVLAGQNPYVSGHVYKNSQIVSAADKCLLVMWLRSPTPDAQVNIFAENATTYAKELFATVPLTSEWRQYLLPFQSSAGYATNQLNFGLHLAWKTQTVEVAGVTVLNFKNNYPLTQLPRNLHNDTYPGSAPDAPWRTAAAASIEQLRKASLTVELRDLHGQPINGAEVKVEMLQHEFAFGSAVISNRFGGGNAQNNTYEQKMLNLDGHGHGFNWVVFENDLKWPAWEQHWYSSQAEIAHAVQWLQARDIQIRGHNLVWPGWAYSPPDLEPNQNNPAYLKNRIRNHLHSILTYPGVGTACKDWDVLNEITANLDYANALAGTPGYVTGRELYAEIFRQADSLAPNSTLYLNDYVALERGNTDDGQTAIWRNRIDELRAAGAPLEGIGFQGHFGAFPTGIPAAKAILDEFYAAYGLEAKITEYDISSLVPPQTQARYMRDILTMSFAHPSMNGFMMWGFWDGAHYQNNAALFNLDWSLKPGGEAFVDQVFRRWWTDTTVISLPGGTAAVRGFRGKYRVTVACNDMAQEQLVTLDGDKTLTFNLDCLVGTPSTETLNFFLMPSPAGSQLMLRWENANLTGPIALRIVDAAGRLREEHTPNASAGQYSFDTTTWPAGAYFLTLENGGRKRTERFVVQH